ncbi:SPARC-like, partial [Notothenia coriiceps]|uniref:SPARC-like n=1 Tax=Notothenia coriiceps TaxID=8208 RepID=A0A6I9NKE8_9TELE
LLFFLTDPCLDHHCKKGKVCEVDEDNTPMCVCQDPSSCPASDGEYEHVCGTNNVTYESSCHFSATKCALEGTKKGHKLHLDYTGPCKCEFPSFQHFRFSPKVKVSSKP